MAIDQEYKERRVNNLPTSGLSAGDKYALNVGGGKYQTYIVSDSLELVKEAGADFIDKNTMAEMRALSAREIWALQNGYYKGVKLNGYYVKGDTPASIDYYISSTSATDDGGSVIEFGGIKLEHKFGTHVNLQYFGLKLDGVSDDTEFFLKAKNYAELSGCKLLFKGTMLITDEISLNKGIKLHGFGFDLSKIHFRALSVDSNNNALKHLFALKNTTGNVYRTMDINKMSIYSLANVSVKNQHVFYLGDVKGRDFIINNISYFNFSGSFIHLESDLTKTYSPEMYKWDVSHISGYNVGGFLSQLNKPKTWIVGANFNKISLDQFINPSSPQNILMDLSGFHETDVNKSVFQGSSARNVNAIFKVTQPNVRIIDAWEEYLSDIPKYMVDARKSTTVINPYNHSTGVKFLSRGGDVILKINNGRFRGSLNDYIECMYGGKVEIDNPNIDSTYSSYLYPALSRDKERFFIPNNLIGRVILNNASSNNGGGYCQNPTKVIYKMPKGQILPSFTATDFVLDNNVTVGFSDLNYNITTIEDSYEGRVIKIEYENPTPTVVNYGVNFKFNFPDKYIGSAISIAMRLKVVLSEVDSSKRFECPNYSNTNVVVNPDFVSAGSSQSVLTKINVLDIKDVWFDSYASYGEMTGNYARVNLFRFLEPSTFLNGKLTIYISEFEVVLGNEMPRLIRLDNGKSKSKDIRYNSLPTKGVWYVGDEIENINYNGNNTLKWVCVKSGNFIDSTPEFIDIYNISKSPDVPNVTTSDATDLATALTLVNELKHTLNDKLSADRTSGQQATT